MANLYPSSPSTAANTQDPMASHTSATPSSPTSTGSVCRGTVCHRILSAISSELNVGMIFALGLDRGLYYKSANGSTWDGVWSSLGGVFTFPPAVISWGEGRIDILGIGSDGAMYTQYFDNNQWSGNWSSLGGVFSSPPAVTSWGKRRLDVFALELTIRFTIKPMEGTKGCNGIPTGEVYKAFSPPLQRLSLGESTGSI